MATPQNRPVPKYRFPTGSRGVGTLICAVLMTLSSRRQFIAPGSFLFENVLSKSQSVARHAKTGQDVVFYFLFGAHALETLVFAATQLSKHGVRITSFAGLSWIVTAFIGGKFAIEDFGLVVAKESGAAAKGI